MLIAMKLEAKNHFAYVVSCDVTSKGFLFKTHPFLWVCSSGPSQDPTMEPKLTLEWYQSSQIIH